MQRTATTAVTANIGKRFILGLLLFGIGGTGHLYARFELWSIGRFEFLFEKLAFVQVGVFAVEGDKLVVGAALDDPAVSQDADEVGVADGRDAVRNDQGRPAFANVAEVVDY